MIIFAGSEDKCFGDIANWEGKFFSFVKRMAKPNPRDSVIRLQGVVDRSITERMPECTRMLLDFQLGGIAEDEEEYRSKVAFRGEGDPLVEKWTRDSTARNFRRLDEWRVMTEAEAKDLVEDIAELTERLHAYLAENPGYLFIDNV